MKALPDGVLVRHRDEEAEAAQNYAKPKEGVEERQRELEDARQEDLADVDTPIRGGWCAGSKRRRDKS